MIWKKQPVGSKLEALDSKINFIDTTTVINNLDNIPLNAQGRITLGASVSPTGSQATFDFHCFGNSAYRGLTIINTYANTMFFNSRHNSSTWKGWEQLALNSNIEEIIKRSSNQATLETGWTATSMYCYRYGSVCVFNVQTLKRTGSTESGWASVATLPSGIVPSSRINSVLSVDSSLSSGEGPIAQIRVNIDGSVEIYAPQNNKVYWGSVVFIINE